MENALNVFFRRKLSSRYITRRLFQLSVLKLSLFRKHQALKFFFQENKPIDIKLKDNTFISCHSRIEAFHLCMYYFVANKLGIYSSKELIAIHNLSNTLNTDLERVFSKDEIFRSATGASPYFTITLLALYALIRYLKPDVIVQTGVASGVSSSLVLLALKLNDKGKLVDIDLPNRKKEGYVYGDGTIDAVYTPNELDPGWLIPNDLRGRWNLKLGPSREVLPKIEKCNIFFHDSEHSYENMTFEFEWAYSKLSGPGLLASDDINANDSWKDFHIKHTDLLPLMGHLELGISLKNAV